MIYLFHLLLGVTLLSWYDDCHAFVPRAFNVKPHRSVPGSASQLFASTDDKTPKNIVIIGGGVAGLSIAHYLAITDSNLKVTLLDRETPEQQREKTTAGSMSGAGCLGHQLVRPSVNGALLSMCEQSIMMYADWVKNVEERAKTASDGVRAKFLWDTPEEPSLKPWEVNYVSNQGCFIPTDGILDQEEPCPSLGPKKSGVTVNITSEAALGIEPLLSPAIENWYYSPWHGTVDARRLTCSLRAACAGAGVQMNFGEEWAVESLAMSDDGNRCTGVNLPDGELYADTVVVANGPFINELVEDIVKVVPVKGQYLTMRMPENTPPLKQPVVSPNAYCYPKSDGRAVVGFTYEFEKTSEDVNQELLDELRANAKRIVPSVEEWEIEGSSVGLRPMTADTKPIWGKTEKAGNLYIAGGFNTYGLLLAPKAGKLIGDLIINNGDASGFEEEERNALYEFKPRRGRFLESILSDLFKDIEFAQTIQICP